MPARKSKKRWLPFALAFTSVLAGLGGASIGWMIRTQALQPPGGQSSGILAPLLNNEQSFPPLENWAGDDPPEVSAPVESETSPYEEPSESVRRDRQPQNPVEEPVYSDVPVRRRAARPEAPASQEFIPSSEQEVPAAPSAAPEPAAELPPQEPVAPVEPPPKLKPEPVEPPAPELPAAPPPEAPLEVAPADSAPVVQ